MLGKWTRELRSQYSTSRSSSTRVAISDITSFEEDIPAIVTEYSHISDKLSIWNLPGFDKSTFYAAALYLHAAAGQLKTEPSSSRPETDELTRNFLDRLADCFAWSKDRDARYHVTATAMIRSEDQKEITVCIAKNHSNIGPYDGSSASISTSHSQSNKNRNEDLATKLFEWFGCLAFVDGCKATCLKLENEAWATMLEHNTSRLEFYIRKIRDASNPSCAASMEVVKECMSYDLGISCSRSSISQSQLLQLDKCVLSAYEARTSKGYKNLVELCNASKEFEADEEEEQDDEPDDKRLGSESNSSEQLPKWINYLGRLRVAFESFIKFCEKYRGYSFEYRLLPSPQEYWHGPDYAEKIMGWAGDLGLDEQREDGRTVIDVIHDVVDNTNQYGSVHCEMQLLLYFTRQGQLQRQKGGQPPEQTHFEKCLDYFGCSKRSCWLCWQVMSRCTNYHTKGLHYTIYPRWTLPSLDFDPEEPSIPRGIKAALEYMLKQIGRKAIEGHSISYQEQKTQSSQRLSRAYPRETETLRHTRPEGTSEQDTSTLNHIEHPGQIAIGSVPALHLPGSQVGAAAGTPREVTIAVYERHSQDLAAFFQRYRLSFKGNQNVVLAPNNGTTLNVSGSVRSEPCPSFSEVEYSLWKEEMFPGPRLDDQYLGVYLMFYQSDGVGRHPNPWILSALNDSHASVLEETVPWHGDVYILPVTLYEGGYIFEIQSLPHEPKIAFPLDCGEALVRLRNSLSRQDEASRKSKIQKDLREFQCYYAEFRYHTRHRVFD